MSLQGKEEDLCCSVIARPQRVLAALEDAASRAPEEPKYAVVFLDNQMPVMSGLDTVARLRELGRKDFVVGVTGPLSYLMAYRLAAQHSVSTGNALLDDQQEYYAAGVDQYVPRSHDTLLPG